MTSPAEQAATTVAAVVEGAVAATESAVEAANERAEAAEEAARLVTEGIAQRAISDRVDDIEEGLEECDGELEQLKSHNQSLTTQLAEMSARLSTLETKAAAPVQVTLAAEPLSSTLTAPEAPAETPVQVTATVQPDQSSEVVAVLPVAETKPKRYRVT